MRAARWGRLPEGGVVHVQVAADGTHDHLPGIEPHANLHGRAASALELVGVEGDPSLHAQRGVAGTDRVVLVPDRRPEERHDSVTHHLVDRALVVMDGLHHPLQHRVEELPGLLGIPVREQLHRALQIGKEDCDLFALAFERGLRGQDLLGEVLRGVGLRRGEAPFRLSLGDDRVAALVTESGLRRELAAARSASHTKPRAAPKAEIGLRRVLALAPGTGHTKRLPIPELPDHDTASPHPGSRQISASRPSLGGRIPDPTPSRSRAPDGLLGRGGVLYAGRAPSLRAASGVIVRRRQARVRAAI
jgi:hypothetical protein